MATCVALSKLFVGQKSLRHVTNIRTVPEGRRSLLELLWPEAYTFNLYWQASVCLPCFDWRFSDSFHFPRLAFPMT